MKPAKPAAPLERKKFLGELGNDISLRRREEHERVERELKSFKDARIKDFAKNAAFSIPRAVTERSRISEREKAALIFYDALTYESYAPGMADDGVHRKGGTPRNAAAIIRSVLDKYGLGGEAFVKVCENITGPLSVGSRPSLETALELIGAKPEMKLLVGGLEFTEPDYVRSAGYQAVRQWILPNLKGYLENPQKMLDQIKKLAAMNGLGMGNIDMSVFAAGPRDVFRGLSPKFFETLSKVFPKALDEVFPEKSALDYSMIFLPIEKIAAHRFPDPAERRKFTAFCHSSKLRPETENELEAAFSGYEKAQEISGFVRKELGNEYRAFAKYRARKNQLPQSMDDAISAILEYRDAVGKSRNASLLRPAHPCGQLMEEGIMEKREIPSFSISKWSRSGFSIPHEMLESISTFYNVDQTQAKALALFVVEGLRLLGNKRLVGEFYGQKVNVFANITRLGEYPALFNGHGLDETVDFLHNAGIIYLKKNGDCISLDTERDKTGGMENLIRYALNFHKKRAGKANSK